MTSLPQTTLPQSPDDAIRPSVCCPGLTKFAFAALAIATVASIATAAYFAGRNESLTQHIDAKQISGDSSASIAGLPILNATAAVTSEKYSIATGSMSDDADGLIVLDHNSGLLQCSIIYPRIGRFMAQYSINVVEALGSRGKGGSYMMLTGHADFPRSSNRPAASTVIYVIDTATGNYACYGVPFNRVASNSNQPQKGTLVWIASGTANPVIDRDDLR